MKKKDKRIANIYIPKTENNEAVSFNILLSELIRLVKEANRKQVNVITFDVDGYKVDLTKDYVKEAIKLAQKQFKYQIDIPYSLRNFFVNLSSTMVTANSEKISARDEEIEKLWSYLCSLQKSNAILIGEHGVGKTTMAMEVVRRITSDEGPSELSQYIVLQVETTKILELMLSKKQSFMYKYIIQILEDFVETNKSKIILYFDNLLHVKYDYELASLFSTLIKKHNVKIIASLHCDDFEDYFMGDTSLMKYLNPIFLEEPDVDEIYPMLKTRIDMMQQLYGVKISEKMVRFAILTGIHLTTSGSANPESTIDTINFALADASRKKQKEVSKQNIYSYYDIDFKLEKRVDTDEKKITAYHEAGHYLVFRMSPNIRNQKSAFVSILPVESALGLTATYRKEGQQLTLSREFYIDEIAFSLGGRIGEAVYTNEYSSGAEADLISANASAERLVLSYGLSNIEGGKNKSYIIGNYIKDYLLTDGEKKKINEEIAAIIEEAYKRAEKIINENKQLLEEIVEKLLADGIVYGDELEEIYLKYHTK